MKIAIKREQSQACLHSAEREQFRALLTMKRFISRAAATLVLMVLTTATAWAWTGSGTSDAPYQIANKSDLETLRDNVNGGTDYENTYFVQTADITLSGAWTPIGKDSSHPFKGRYDGGGFTISGLTVTITNGQYAGLFGNVKGGTYQGSNNYGMNRNIVTDEEVDEGW